MKSAANRVHHLKQVMPAAEGEHHESGIAGGITRNVTNVVNLASEDNQNYWMQGVVVAIYFAGCTAILIHNESKEVPCDDVPEPITLELVDPDDGGGGTVVATYEMLTKNNPSLVCTEPWTILEAMYFLIVTVTTVGYGDFGPTTPEMKGFTIVLIIVGLGFVGAILGNLITDFIEKKQQQLMEKIDDDPDDGRSPHEIKVLLSILIILVVLFGGTLFYHFNEDHLSFLDAFYWSFTSTTTVGYGDRDVNKSSSHTFAILYLFTSTMVVAVAIGNFGAVQMEINAEKKRAEMLCKNWDNAVDLLKEMDRDGNDEIDKGEFLAAMLIGMGKITSEDSDPILKKFDEIDKDGNGFLDKNDIRQLEEEAKAAEARQLEAEKQNKLTHRLSRKFKNAPARQTFNGKGSTMPAEANMDLRATSDSQISRHHEHQPASEPDQPADIRPQVSAPATVIYQTSITGGKQNIGQIGSG